MKRTNIVLLGLTVLTAGVLPVRAQDTLESQLNIRLDRANALSLTEAKPAEIVKGRLTYSGIGVAWFKTDNVLQLFNPLAPPKYGSGEENILRHPTTGRVHAWKLLSVRF